MIDSGTEESWGGRSETCNGIDDDHDGEVDEAPVKVYYLDQDGDRYGTVPGDSCEEFATAVYVERCCDCDDADPAVYPYAEEVCNGTDDDCDGEVDEDLDCPDTGGADTSRDSGGADTAHEDTAGEKQRRRPGRREHRPALDWKGIIEKEQ